MSKKKKVTRDYPSFKHRKAVKAERATVTAYCRNNLSLVGKAGSPQRLGAKLFTKEVFRDYKRMIVPLKTALKSVDSFGRMLPEMEHTVGAYRMSTGERRTARAIVGYEFTFNTTK